MKTMSDKVPSSNLSDKIKNPFIGMKREEIERVVAGLEGKLVELEAMDPFYYFKPTTGVIEERERAFLLKYLKEEDIPDRVDGQVDMMRQTRGIVGSSGGNQSGKSVSGTIRGYIRTTGEVPEIMEGWREYDFDRERAKKKFIRGRVVGVDFKQLSNTVLPTWQEWAPRKYLKNGKWTDSYSSQHNMLTLYRNKKPCGTIEFMTNKMETESFQGPPLDWVVYDEEPKAAIHKENLMRFTTSDSLDMDFCFTPTAGITWTADLFMGEGFDGQDCDAKLFKLCSVNNPKANLEVLEKILNEITDYNELKMRLLGEFVSLSGLVYGKLFKPEHIIKPFFDDLTPGDKKDYLCLFGCDPHLVTDTAGVWMLVDREGNMYVDRCYAGSVDTDEFKADFHRIVKDSGYRMGWCVADKSSNSTIIAFGGRNIYRELRGGENAIPALRTSEKYEGSIKAGVNEIKKMFKENRLFVVDRRENRELIKSFRTLERDTYANEDKSGPKDRIAEGRHHHHASLRYIFQYPINWYPEQMYAPEPAYFDEVVVG